MSLITYRDIPLTLRHHNAACVCIARQAGARPPAWICGSDLPSRAAAQLSGHHSRDDVHNSATGAQELQFLEELRGRAQGSSAPRRRTASRNRAAHMGVLLW